MWPFGKTESETVIEDLSKTITNIAMSNINRCVVNSSQEQDAVIKNSGFKIFSRNTVSQTTTVNASCAMNSSLEANLQNDIISAISQKTTSTGHGILSAFGNTEASARATLATIIESNVKMENIMEMYNRIEQKQRTGSENDGVVLVEVNDFSQGAQVFAAATLSALENAGVFNTIRHHIDQVSSAESKNPFSFLTDMFGTFTWAILVGFLFLVIVIAGLIWAFWGKNKSGAWAEVY